MPLRWSASMVTGSYGMVPTFAARFATPHHRLISRPQDIDRKRREDECDANVSLVIVWTNVMNVMEGRFANRPSIILRNIQIA